MCTKPPLQLQSRVGREGRQEAAEGQHGVLGQPRHRQVHEGRAPVPQHTHAGLQEVARTDCVRETDERLHPQSDLQVQAGQGLGRDTVAQGENPGQQEGHGQPEVEPQDQSPR